MGKSENPQSPPGFMIYLADRDIMAPLNDKQRTKLLYAMFDFVDTQIEPDFEDPLLILSWAHFRQVLKHDRERYLAICEKNRRAANKRWHEGEEESSSADGPEDGTPENSAKEQSRSDPGAKALTPVFIPAKETMTPAQALLYERRRQLEE